MTLSNCANEEIGRLLNGQANPQAPAISYLAVAACRLAESMEYLLKVDDQRFGGVWPADTVANDAVDDAHVRWAAMTAVSTIDLCTAAAGRLGGFGQRPRKGRGEDDMRTFYRYERSGKLVDERHRVPSPWRQWVDLVVNDPRYLELLDIRNSLVHSAIGKGIQATTASVAGHDMRLVLYVGPLDVPISSTTHQLRKSREVIESAASFVRLHATEFVAVLKSIP